MRKPAGDMMSKLAPFHLALSLPESIIWTAQPRVSESRVAYYGALTTDIPNGFGMSKLCENVDFGSLVFLSGVHHGGCWRYAWPGPGGLPCPRDAIAT